MVRKLLLAASFVAVGATAFAAASLAISSRNPAAPTFPALDLPSTQLSKEAQIALSNDIGPLAADVGITADSYNDVRRVSSTSLGDLQLVVGSQGACLVLDHAVSCGNPNTGQYHYVSLFRIDPTSGLLIGGGIVQRGVKGISFPTDAGRNVQIPVTNGVFIVDRVPHVSNLRATAVT
jgi:hypothetical protein